MKAVLLNKGGNSDVLQFAELPVPVIRHENQVLVKVHAAGINPIDTKIRSMPERFPVSLPAILGCDAAGVIEAIGENVKGFNEGDAVYFSQPGFNDRQGTYAEYAVVDASLLAHKPTKLSFVQAAAAPLVLITAWEALHDRARIQSGQKVLIHAGAGGVGHVAIQLARLAGAMVCTTVSNDQKSDFVKRLGADKIINYTRNDVQDEVMAWTNNHGVDIAFDTVGGKVLESCFSCTRVYGDVVSLLQPAADINWSEARMRNLRFSFELMLSPVMLELESAKQHQGDILRHCVELFDQGRLELPEIKAFTLEEAAAAHDYLEQQHPVGKVVLTV